MPRSSTGPVLGRKVFPNPRFRLHMVRMEAHHAFTAPHAHNFEELVVITGGRGQHQVGDDVYDISAGDVFVILKGMSHCYPQVENLDLINFLFDPAHLQLPQADLRTLPGYHALFQVEPHLRKQGHFKNRLKLDVDELGYLSTLTAELEAELSNNAAGSQFLATAHFMRIFGWLSRAYTRIPTAKKQPLEQITKLLSHLERHYAEPLSIEDLAKVAGSSPSNLFRLFRHVTGCSPVEYLIRLRVRKAAHMLCRETVRISEVSQAAGFSDSNYFSRQFHRVMGVSPREYRHQSLAGLRKVE